MNDRPFEPGVDRSKIIVDEEFMRAIRSNAIADWNGKNWETIESFLLIHCHVRPEELPTMTLFQIRMRFQPLRLKLSGRIETATDSIVPFGAVREELTITQFMKISGKPKTTVADHKTKGGAMTIEAAEKMKADGRKGKKIPRTTESSDYDPNNESEV